MIKIDKPRRIFIVPLVLLYSCLSLAYFNTLDTKFYVKNIFNCGIALAVPLPYIILVFIFILFSSSILKASARAIEDEL